MRPSLVTLAVAGSLLAAGPLVAQSAVAAPATPSVLTLTPHVGMTTYSDIAKLSLRDDGSFSGVPLTGSMSAKLDAQLTLGVSGEYSPLASRWGAFADFSRSGGEGKLALRFCDPDFGCETDNLDAEGSQWRASVGVTRRIPFGTGSMATLSLGALYAKTHFEAKDATSDAPKLDESSPGGTIGAALDFPLSPRVGIRVQARDALMRVSASSFSRDLNEIFFGSGLTVGSEDKFVNAFTFGAGMVLHW